MTNNLGRIARLMSRSDVDELVEAGARRLDDIEYSTSHSHNPLIGREGIIHDVEDIEVRFNTADEASEYLRTAYGIEADFSGAHMRNVHLIVNEIDSVAGDLIYGRAFAQIQDELDGIHIRMVGEAFEDPRLYHPEGGGIYFTNDGTALNIEFNLAKFAHEAPVSLRTVAQVAGDDTIFHLGRNIPESFLTYNVGAAVRHEIAHVIDSWIRTRIPREIAEFPPYPGGSIVELIARNEEILERVSYSSTQSPYSDFQRNGEFFAESSALLEHIPENLPPGVSEDMLNVYITDFRNRLNEVIRGLLPLSNEFPYSTHHDPRVK